MPQIPADEYDALPLRAHSFLAGVALHDVWAVDLPRPHQRVTFVDFDPLRRQPRERGRFPDPSRALVRLRLMLGPILRLDDVPKDAAARSFATRLTSEDLARSLVQPGTREGMFRIVYRFEDESLVELQNRTAHAAAVSALVETQGGYRYYLAVYVANASALTPLYMTLIDPFRRWFVYPAMLNNVRKTWRSFVSPATS